MPCPMIDASLLGTLMLMVTISPWFTVKVEGVKLNERALMLIVTAASGMIDNGCGITGPWLDIDAIIMRR